MAESDRHRYARLVQGHTRICVLSPSKDIDQIISIELRSTFLDSPIKYEALSYTWGTSQADRIIVLDDSPFPVTSNLYEALVRLREPKKPRYLWIDAICIDQNNPVERNEQVLLMASIFRQAESVQIWLGEDSEQGDGKKSMTYFRSVSDQITRDVFAGGPKLWMDLDEPGPAERLYIYLMPTLLAFLTRAWFGRRWVIQEVFHSKRANLVCGPHTLDWSDLTRAVRSHALINDEVANIMVPFSRLEILNGSEDILELLRIFDGYDCAEPRDRIFALLSLSNPRYGVVPDYAATVEDVYFRFAQKMLSSNHARHLLLHAAVRAPDRRTRRNILPSWVPDWRVKAIVAGNAMIWDMPRQSTPLGDTRPTGLFWIRRTDPDDERIIRLPLPRFGTLAELETLATGPLGVEDLKLPEHGLKTNLRSNELEEDDHIFWLISTKPALVLRESDSPKANVMTLVGWYLLTSVSFQIKAMRASGEEEMIQIA